MGILNPVSQLRHPMSETLQSDDQGGAPVCNEGPQHHRNSNTGLPIYPKSVHNPSIRRNVNFIRNQHTAYQTDKDDKYHSQAQTQTQHKSIFLVRTKTKTSSHSFRQAHSMINDALTATNHQCLQASHHTHTLFTSSFSSPHNQHKQPQPCRGPHSPLLSINPLMS